MNRYMRSPWEATGLTWQNVDLEQKPRGVVRFIETKSGKPRSVPMTARVQGLLTRLREACPEGETHVFLVHQPGCSWRKRQPRATPFGAPYRAWYTAVAKADLKDVVIHDLRHTFASRLVQRGVPLITVSKLLGHASLTMTMRYAHLAPDNLDEAILALEKPAVPPAGEGSPQTG